MHVTGSSERAVGSSFVTDPGACGEALSKNDPTPLMSNLAAMGLVTDARGPIVIVRSRHAKKRSTPPSARAPSMSCHCGRDRVRERPKACNGR